MPFILAASIMVVFSSTDICFPSIVRFTYRLSASFKYTESEVITAKTPGRLLLRFFFCHAVLHAIKVADSFACLPFCHVDSSAWCTVMKACFRNIHVTGYLMMISQIFVNICCNYLGRRNCFDYGCRAARTVSSREDAGIFSKAPVLLVTIFLVQPGYPPLQSVWSQYSVRLLQLIHRKVCKYPLLLSGGYLHVRS